MDNKDYVHSFDSIIDYSIYFEMIYKGWKNIKRIKPPINELIGLKYMITGIGAPERKGWESIGRMRKNGRFSINQNNSKTVDYRIPTHWKIITE